MYDSKYKCVPPRCRLCRFPILEGENVKAVTETGNVGSEFPYIYSNDFRDNSLGYIISPCRGLVCSHGDTLIGCHSACLRFASAPSASYLQVMQYSFEPMESEDRRRLEVIPRLFAEILRARYKQLPIELCLTIAEYIVHESAIIANHCASSGSTPDAYDIDTTSSIWARYNYLDGVRYIVSLSNKPYSSKDVCIFETDGTSLADTVYTSEDHLGIKQIIFSTPNSSINLLAPDNGDLTTWWHTISIASYRTLRVKSDGCKIRRINISPTPELDKVILWSTLMLPREIQLLHIHSLAQQRRDMLERNTFRMTSFECNNEAITGLSLSWECGMLFFHAHRDKEDISFYRHIDRRQRNAVWTYVPFDDGESITAIWWRADIFNAFCAVVVKTNKGRVVTMGPHLNPRRPPPVWSRVFVASGGPDRIYWDYSEWGSKKLATTSPADHTPGPSISHISPRPYTSGPILYSSASLKDVIGITPCQKRHDAHVSITGLLIRYANNCQACVGEVRLDGLCTTMKVENSPALYLGFAYTGFASTEHRFPYLAKIELLPPRDREPYKWLELGWQGMLEWWYESRQCKIWYNDKESPATHA